jgi:hypothetical protein
MLSSLWEDMLAEEAAFEALELPLDFEELALSSVSPSGAASPMAKPAALVMASFRASRALLAWRAAVLARRAQVLHHLRRRERRAFQAWASLLRERQIQQQAAAEQLLEPDLMVSPSLASPLVPQFGPPEDHTVMWSCALGKVVMLSPEEARRREDASAERAARRAARRDEAAAHRCALQREAVQRAKTCCRNARRKMARVEAASAASMAAKPLPSPSPRQAIVRPSGMAFSLFLPTVIIFATVLFGLVASSAAL